MTLLAVRAVFSSLVPELPPVCLPCCLTTHDAEPVFDIWNNKDIFERGCEQLKLFYAK